MNGPVSFESASDSSHHSASSRVASEILTMVEEGLLVSGQSLPPERDLSEKFGVSRTTVREAIHELTLRGLVRRRQGSGTVLAGESKATLQLLGEMGQAERDAREEVDLRLVLEPQIASLAARRRTESDIVYLQALCADTEETLTPESSLELDQKFHSGVARAAQNQLIASLERVVSEWIVGFREVSHATEKGRKDSMTWHRRILDAIVQQDADLAFSLMSAHVRDMGQHVVDTR